MKLIARISWVIVVAVALSISWWSLWAVGRHYGLPSIPAAGLSTVFDGAALVASSIALSHAQRHGDTGTGARATVFLLVLSSAYLNADHAAILRDRFPAYLMFAMPPVVAWLIFELHTRWIRRDALIKAGRVPKPLPAFGHPVWIDHPATTYKARRRITAVHRDQAEHAATYSLGSALQDITSRVDAIRLGTAATESSDPVIVYAWIRENRHYMPAEYQGIDQTFVRKQLTQIQRRAITQDDWTDLDSPSPQDGLNGDSPKREPVGSVTAALPAPAQPGDMITLGCGHLVAAERVVKLADMHPCPIHGRNVPWLGGARLDDLNVRN